MELDLSKDKRQREVISKWKANNGKGTFLAVTGFGKTRVGTEGAKLLCDSGNATRQRTVTVIVPNLQLVEDWTRALQAYDFPCEVYTVQTATRRFTKANPLRTSLLILDEVHRYSEEAVVFSTILDVIKYDFLLNLSATLDPEDPKFQRIMGEAPLIDRVTLEEARSNGWVSPFQIYNLGLEMTPDEEKTYKGLSSDFNKYFKTFDFDYGFAMDCLQNRQLRERHAKAIGWKAEVVMVHAVQLTRVVQKRKKFLYEIPSKLKACKEIIDRFSGKTFITFSQSTDFADDLAEILGNKAVAFHSNLRTLIENKKTGRVVAKAVKVDGKTRYKDKYDEVYTWKQVKEAYPNIDLTRKGSGTRRKEAIKRLKDGRTNVEAIVTARALDEGFDYPGIDASIVASGTSKTRQSIQRLGRMIRQQEGKNAFQVELYIRDTQDENWLRRRQKESININWIQSINEIPMT